MDKKKTSSKFNWQNMRSSGDQQMQIALAQNLGIPPEFLDPSMLGYSPGLFPPGLDAQQFLNPMSAPAAGYPFMNTAALQAFAGAGLGAMAGQTPEATEWWNLAQNQALAASLGVGFYPGMLPPGFPGLGTEATNKQKLDSNEPSRSSDHFQASNSRFSPHKSSPRIGSSGLSNRIHNSSRKKSNDSHQSSSKDRPDSRHSLNSPFHSSQVKRNSPLAKQPSSWMDSQQSQKVNERVFQDEFMRQLEQQLLVQQLQQQQQQEQLSATLQSVISGNTNHSPGTSASSSSRKKNTLAADKMQQQLSQVIFQQLLQAGAAAGRSPLSGNCHSNAAATSFLSSPSALEAMMSLNQMGNTNALSDLKALSNKTKDYSSNHSEKAHSSSSSNNRTHQKIAPLSKSSFNRKLHSPSHKSRTHPGELDFPGFSVPELPPDTALLAALYSQQLQQQQQYEAMMKEVNVANRASRINESKPSFSIATSSKSKSNGKHDLHYPDQRQHHEFTIPSSHNRSNIHSPANSTSSRGKSHTSPHRDSSHSPARKSRVPERSQSRGSSGSAGRMESPSMTSVSKGTKRRQEYGQDVSDTLKLFSALATKPNLSQEELTALLRLTPGTDPTSLFAGMNAMGTHSSSNDNNLSNAAMDKFNLAALFALETQRIEEQLKLQQMKLEKSLEVKKETSLKDDKKKDTVSNRVSVIHENNTLVDSTDWPSSSSSSHSIFQKDFRKHSKYNSAENKLKNGDIVSSDGEYNSENSLDYKTPSIDSSNLLPGKQSRKRRRTVTSEDEVMEPLKHGWKREVRFKTFGNQLHDEVIYITPEGKKLRTFLEVDKHLEDNKISSLYRNNFSFSSKVPIGSFFEQRDKNSNDWSKVTYEEFDQKLDEFKRSTTPTSSCPENSDVAEQNENSTACASLEKQSRNDNKEKQKSAKAVAQEREHQKQQMKLLQQEKMQKIEQQRMEKEIRGRLAFEELERQRIAEALDRDQRRQQLLLMRALESRKRAEERERRREEIRVEKMMQRERKMEQRRIAMQIARELKMPVDDMSTIGAPELPGLTSLQGTLENKCPYQLSGNATADILMVLEFVTTFKDSIHIDENAIPTFEQLQLGLMNDPQHTGTVVKLTTSLLHQCLCDPGVPAPGPWLHCLTGVKVIDIDVKENNFSEILRLFIWARNSYKTDIAVRLETIPFLSLTTDEKAQSLAFLVNELVCSRPICNEIERNLDALATLRRDKWMVEGQIRQLRVAHERNCSVELLNKNTDTDENSNSSSPKKSFPRNSGIPVCETSSEQQDGQLQQDESPESVFHKKMEELTKQHHSFNTRLADNSKPLRALDLGQDRFKRRYWVLPNLGGVYIEGLESGISYEDDDESPDEDEEEEEEIKREKEDKMQEENRTTEMDIQETCRDNGEAEVEKMEVADEEKNLVRNVGDADVEHAENMVLCDESGNMTAVVLADKEGAVPDITGFTEENKGLNRSVATSNVDELSHLTETDSQSHNQPEAVNGANLILENSYTVETFNNHSTLHLSSTTEEHKENLDCLDSAVQDKGVFTNSSLPDDRKDLTSQIDQNLNLSENESTVFEIAKSCGNETALKIDEATSSKSGSHKTSENQLETSSNAQIENTNNSETRQTSNSEVQITQLNENCIREAEEEAKETVGKVNSAFKPTVNAANVVEPDVFSLTRLGALRALKEQDKNLQKRNENDSVLVAAKAIAAKAVASSSHLLFPRTENDDSNSEKLATTNATLLSSDTMATTSCSETQSSSLQIGSHTINALKQIGMNPSSLTSQQLEALSHLDKSDAKSLKTSTVENSDDLKELWYSVIPKKPCDDTTLESLPESPKDPVASPSREEAKERKDSNEEQPQLSEPIRKISSEQDMPMDLSCANAKTFISGSSSRDPVLPAELKDKVITVKQEPGSTPYSSQTDSPDSKPNLADKFFVPITYNNNFKMNNNHRRNPYNQIVSSCPSPNTLANYIISSANSGYFQFPSMEDIQFPIRAPDTKEQPDPIPREMKRGWWRIESEAELRSLSEKLHLRGIREKQLHRSITKHFDLCTNSMADAKDPSHQFAIISKKSPVEEKRSHASKLKKIMWSSAQEKKDSDAVPFATDEELAFRVEMKILNQVEELSDRCCEMVVVSSQWENDNPKPSKYRTDLKHVPLPALRDETGAEVKFDLTNPIQHSPVSALGTAVDLLGRLERAVCRRYLKPPLVRKGGATEFSSLPSLSESGAMDVAAGLRTWRNAIASCTSASQLSLCVRMLETCIAWNRSVKSPVKPEITLTGKQPKKRKNEKRPQNKIANGIDGLSTPKKRRKKKVNASKNQTGAAEKTSKSKKLRMPIDTADIISKTSSDGTVESENSALQLVNGNMTDDSNLINFDAFSPLSSGFENSTWSESCDDRTTENGLSDFSKGMGDCISPPAECNFSDNFSEEYKPNAESKKKKKKKKSKKSKPDTGKNGEEKKKVSKGKKFKDKEAVLCRTALQELQSHEDATWFLFPVDCKAVPGYRKIIKKPIDFHTIECRIKKGRYKTRQEFVEEVRLVFDNCQKFNEDDSNIGRAGHRLREYFERRWKELVVEKYGEGMSVSSNRQASDDIGDCRPADLVSIPHSACISDQQEFVMES